MCVVVAGRVGFNVADVKVDLGVVRADAGNQAGFQNLEVMGAEKGAEAFTCTDFTALMTDSLVGAIWASRGCTRRQ